MSDWSSFQNDKKLTDSWRQYLCEREGRKTRLQRLVGHGRKATPEEPTPPTPTPPTPTPTPPETTAVVPVDPTRVCPDDDPIAFIMCMMTHACDVQQLEPKKRDQELTSLKKTLQQNPDQHKEFARQVLQKLKTQPDPCPGAPGQIPGKPAPGQIPGKPAPGQIPGRDQLQITGPTADPTKRPETRVVYYLDDSYRADRLKGSWDSVNQRKGGFRFEDDLAAFLNFFGPFVPKHVTEKGLTEAEYDAIKKVADSDYLRGRMDKILPAFQKLLRSKPKEAEKVNRMARIFQKETGRKEFGRLMLKIRKKTINLKAHPETPPSGEPPATVRRNEHVAWPKQPPSEIYEERSKRQDKTLFENWQRIAGINPRVL